MQVQPASINQVMTGADGRMVEIDADVGRVVEDLKRIDPHLGVRFVETANPPYWCVYESPDERTTRLVLTAQAYQGVTGAWLGLDQRVVRRIEEIGHATYDFAAALEARNAAAEKARTDARREKLAEKGAEAFSMLRKLQGRKDRAVITRKPDGL